MSGTKSSRLSLSKKDTGMRYSTRNGKGELIEKSKHQNLKESKSSKACECKGKQETSKTLKKTQNSKLPVKKSNTKAVTPKETKKKSNSLNHKEKVVIVSKRSSSVSVVKSSKLSKSVSVRKVSYSTSVVFSSEEEDSDSEDDSEEEEKEYSRRRRTVLKRTTSKVKSNVSESKRTETRSAQKAKAIKLLCEKLSTPSKHKTPSRELRPRFPYNMLQELPTARTHRMASLNALAKVHVVYENEGRTVGENLNEADECSLIDFLNENSDIDDDDDDDVEVKKETKPAIKGGQTGNSKKIDKSKNNEADKIKNAKKEKPAPPKPKIQRRGKKRKLPDVEIIDTKICKRMASLNAQAILAASYLQEPKPKRMRKNCKNTYSSKEQELLAAEFDLTLVKTEKIDEEEEVQITQHFQQF